MGGDSPDKALIDNSFIICLDNVHCRRNQVSSSLAFSFLLFFFFFLHASKEAKCFRKN